MPEGRSQWLGFLDPVTLGRFSPSAEGYRSPLPDDDVIDDVLRRVDEIAAHEEAERNARDSGAPSEKRPGSRS